jgi:hypothetical protein
LPFTTLIWNYGTELTLGKLLENAIDYEYCLKRKYKVPNVAQSRSSPAVIFYGYLKMSVDAATTVRSQHFNKSLKATESLWGISNPTSIYDHVQNKHIFALERSILEASL